MNPEINPSADFEKDVVENNLCVVDTINISDSDKELDQECKHNGTFKPTLIAKYIYSKFDEKYHFIKTDKDNTIWVYDKPFGMYRDCGEDIIRAIVQMITGMFFNKHLCNEVIEVFKTWRKPNYLVTRQQLNGNPQLLNLKNGVYNIDLKILFSHDHKYLFTSQIPVIYDENTKIDKIDTFLKQVLQAEDIKIIQELIGYCFYRKYHIHKAFMLIGSGRNGKSTLIELIRKLVGEDNCTSVSLQDVVYNRFTSAKLFGKMGNLYADLSKKSLSQTGAFKMLTGGDRIFADIKHQEGFEFTNYAKLIYSCNELPRTNDDTHAYFSRWFIIEFKNRFEGENCDENIFDKLTTEKELSGLFNWAIEGLTRLLETNKFSTSKTTDEIKEEYISRSSPVKAFIIKHIMVIVGAKETKADVYNCYKEFCEENGFSVKPSNIFSRELKDNINDLEDEQPHGSKRIWRGIAIL